MQNKCFDFMHLVKYVLNLRFILSCQVVYCCCTWRGDHWLWVNDVYAPSYFFSSFSFCEVTLQKEHTVQDLLLAVNNTKYSLPWEKYPLTHTRIKKNYVLVCYCVVCLKKKKRTLPQTAYCLMRIQSVYVTNIRKNKGE